MARQTSAGGVAALAWEPAPDFLSTPVWNAARIVGVAQGRLPLAADDSGYVLEVHALSDTELGRPYGGRIKIEGRLPGLYLPLMRR